MSCHTSLPGISIYMLSSQRYKITPSVRFSKSYPVCYHRTKHLSYQSQHCFQIQEVPCDEIEQNDALAGPILHILPSEEVELSPPAKVTIPITLQEDLTELPDLSSSGVRLFRRSSFEPLPEWTEITEKLKASADLKNGIITVQVKHFSE